MTTASPTPTTRAEARGESPSRRQLTVRNWADIAVLMTLSVLGIIGFEPSFGGYSFLLAGLGGLVIGAATGILTAVYRLGALTTVLVAIIGYFLLGTAFAVPSQGLLFVFPSLQSLSSLAVGAVYGWADIVTLSTPIGAPEYIAVVPFFGAWLVALLSATLALRWLPATDRGGWRLGLVLLGPIALYLVGVLVGTRDPYLAGIRGVSFAILALLWLGWRRSYGSTRIVSATASVRNRKFAGMAIILVGAAVVGGGAAIAIAPPNDSRFVLREEIEPPFDPLQYPSPLAGFRHYTKDAEDTVLFTVEGLQAGDAIRLATLDSFTGKLWTVTGPQLNTNGSGSFGLVGREIPEPTFFTSERSAQVTVTIAEYSDVWVPGVGYATGFELLGDAASKADSLRYNGATGTAVLTTGLTEGDSYRVEAVVQTLVDASELSDVAIASVQLPQVEFSPDIVAAKAIEFSEIASTPAEKLEAMRRVLVDTGYLSHGRASDSVPSRAGHGADRVRDLFERNQMIGDAEQYASAFALMARSLGYPARVVMGFKPEIVDGQTSVEVVGDDVTAWVEVAFDGVGWVAFDATPDETDIPQDETPKPKKEPQPQVRQPPRAESDENDLLTPVELEKTDDESDDPFQIPEWVLVLAASLLIPAAIVFLPVLIAGALRARRMRRRKTAERVPDRVAGAWDELLDRYRELGYRPPAKATRKTVAAGLESQLDDAAGLPDLAVATDEAVFSGADVADQTSERVWTEAMAAVAVAKRAVSRWRLILSYYRVRSSLKRKNRASESEADRA